MSARVKITPEVKKEGDEADESEEMFKLSVGRLQRRWWMHGVAFLKYEQCTNVAK